MESKRRYVRDLVSFARRGRVIGDFRFPLSQRLAIGIYSRAKVLAIGWIPDPFRPLYIA